MIVVTAYATVDTAVEAVKRGAEDYLPKPFTPEQIRHAVTKVAAARDTRRRVLELEAELHQSVPEVDLATESPAHAFGVRDDCARRAGERAGPAARRERHRQGRAGARAARAEPAGATAPSSP